MKLTKIIATIGPACESEEAIEKLISKGVNIFRFNFKHSTPEWHEEIIARVRKVAASYGAPIGTLIDLAGPEIRIRLRGEHIDIKEGESYSFGPDEEIAITHHEIYRHLKEGQKVMADDGAFHFTLRRKNKRLSLLSHSDGVLKNKKSLNIPGNDFPVDLLVDRDLEGLRLAHHFKLDFIALSFIRSPKDIKFLRQEMKKMHIKSKVVAKIETQQAIENLKEIVKEADIVMVARGDLGVEFPFEQVPYYQKKIIKECLEQGKPVITATQMLESMIEHPYPTRAEISDVANATYDLTDAVMLSAESAIGKYPSKAVATMARAVSFSERITEGDVRLRHEFDIDSQTELLSDAAYNLYYKYRKRSKIAAFVVLTQTGKTASKLSRYRPHIPIYAFAPTKEVASALTINFGVYPFVSSTHKTDKKEVRREDVRDAVERLRSEKLIEKGDKLIAVYGDVWGVAGGATTIRLITA